MPLTKPKPQQKPKIQRLSIFLLREALSSPEDAIEQAGTKRDSVGCGGITGILFHKQSPSHSPKWAAFFQGDPVLTKLQALHIANSGALLLVPASGRWFALAWGIGRHWLRPGSCEDDFGLLTTLNSIASDQVRSVDHTSFDARTLQHRAQSSHAGTCIELGIDIDQNLVKAITGTPSDPTLAARMSGVDALVASVPVDRAHLPQLLERYLQQYVSTAYKQHFEWVDHIRPISDRARIDALNTTLIDNLRNGHLHRTWLAIPEIVEQDDIESYAYRPGARAARYDNVALHDFLATVKTPSTIDIHTLKQGRVYGHRANVPNHPTHWSVYRCLYTEIDIGQDVFLLYNGKWYRITRDFVANINGRVASYVVPSTLPAYDTTLHRDEEAYNHSVASAYPDLLCLDRELISHGGHQSKIEVCDLLSLDKRLIHIKRGTRSATLSHLFNQGEVSARLLLGDKDFRRKVAHKLRGAHQGVISSGDIKPSEFTIVFAIVCDAPDSVDSLLPFFSRMTFSRVAATLQGFGYKVEIAKIEQGSSATLVTTTPQATPITAIRSSPSLPSSVATRPTAATGPRSPLKLSSNLATMATSIYAKSGRRAT